MTSDERKHTAVDGGKASALEAYNAVVADAELSDIRLVLVDFRIKPEYYTLIRDEKTKKVKLKRNFSSDLTNFFCDPKTKMLGGQFE